MSSDGVHKGLKRS